MTSESKQSVRFDKDGDPELPFAWQQVHGAIWLIGIAILAVTHKWWPGILILVAISGLAQAAIVAYLRQGDERRDRQVESLRQESERHAAEETRATALPSQCPGCGAPLTAKSVLWQSGTTAKCPYCHTAVKASSVTK